MIPKNIFMANISPHKCKRLTQRVTFVRKYDPVIKNYPLKIEELFI